MSELIIDQSDNVAVRLDGEIASNPNELARITDSGDIPAGHKFALKDIKKGENVIKYGYPIGHAILDIAKGEWVHTHNVKTNLEGKLSYTYQPELANSEVNVVNELKVDLPTIFMGYRRKNGEVGVRNDLYIVPTVGCINNTAQRIKDLFLKENPNALDIFDNIIVVKHPYGCSQLGKDHRNTRDFLANTVLHPNAAAVLVVGLGCENNTIDVFKDTLKNTARKVENVRARFRRSFSKMFKDTLENSARKGFICGTGMVPQFRFENMNILENTAKKGARGNCEPLFNENTASKIDNERIKFLISQEVEDEVREGVNALSELINVVKLDKRVEIPISELKIGLKCGGSDGFSGITANPLLGKLSDYICQSGGSTVLTEVPEMFGAETILMNRAVDEQVFGEIVRLINDFKQYFIDHNEVVYENPSPGNKAGGITTLEDKSLGCTQKAGSCKVVDVIDYAGQIKEKGLSLLQSPGNDLVAASALAVAGCHIVLFTTGRGNPFGTFVPTVKVASNTRLSNRKSGWIDFDAGRLVNESMDEIAAEFIKDVVSIASGVKTKSEENGYSEVAIFKTGITL